MYHFIARWKKDCVTYKGDFDGWEEAASRCEGYDSRKIFEKVKSAALAVKSGEACYERDSFLFYDNAVNYNLMTYLLRIAIRNDGKLRILDWGGSLGSTYFQHRKFMEGLFKEFQWTVIEQEHFVQFGKEALQDDVLTFASIPGEKDDLPEHNCILISSSLQYISDYMAVLKQIFDAGPEHIILERTPVGKRDRIWIERVREPIYEASYPCYVFEEEKLLHIFSEAGYILEDRWESLVDEPIELLGETITLKSFVFKKNK